LRFSRHTCIHPPLFFEKFDLTMRVTPRYPISPREKILKMDRGASVEIRRENFFVFRFVFNNWMTF
ncbi:hypothetical protein, partial [Enterococcus durans]|uniref:hypothetical protein n=1 Tax=Enterococcus durans TaxID=53345 RepID=UPI0039A533F8